MVVVHVDHICLQLVISDGRTGAAVESALSSSTMIAGVEREDPEIIEVDVTGVQTAVDAIKLVMGILSTIGFRPNEFSLDREGLQIIS